MNLDFRIAEVKRGEETLWTEIAIFAENRCMEIKCYDDVSLRIFKEIQKRCEVYQEKK